MDEDKSTNEELFEESPAFELSVNSSTLEPSHEPNASTKADSPRPEERVDMEPVPQHETTHPEAVKESTVESVQPTAREPIIEQPITSETEAASNVVSEPQPEAEAIPQTQSDTVPQLEEHLPSPVKTEDPPIVSSVASPSHATVDALPAKAPENQDGTVQLISASDIESQAEYVRKAPENVEPKTLQLKSFYDPDRLNEFEDSYVQILRDPKGETKVSEDGLLLGDRKYLFSTFTLPGRGKRLYVVAAEAARSLSYRDSSVLFVRNKSLVKITCDDEERRFLEQSEMHVTKMRSRPITLVSARALFLAFGARVILHGKRVVDDYWEEAALEQGLTPEDIVFPNLKKFKRVRKAKSNPNRKIPIIDPRLKLKLPTTRFINPIPPLEDRKEYLIAQSNGTQSQVLPGQGITGSFELASASPIPKYRNEASTVSKQKSILSTLGTSTPSMPTQVVVTNSLPVDEKLIGERAPNGLPYYHPSISKRIASEGSEQLTEIEYLHGTVETNKLITVGRAARNKQWAYYWQARSGTTLGLTKRDEKQFFENSLKFLNEEETEIRYNDMLNCDQVITKKKRPNPNYLGKSNITGLKPPYIDKPPTPNPKIEEQAHVASLMHPNGLTGAYPISAPQQQQQQQQHQHQHQQQQQQQQQIPQQRFAAFGQQHAVQGYVNQLR